MLRSRLLYTSQPILQRTIVTQPKVSVNNENKLDQKDKTNEDQSSSNSFDPPRRPLTQQFTHQVTNQVPPLEYFDLYKNDLTLREFVTKENKGQIKDMGIELGTFHWLEQGQLANRYPPALNQFDRYGQRIDEVQFHPAYHDLMQVGMRYGVSNSLSVFSIIEYLQILSVLFSLALGSFGCLGTITRFKNMF
jgi:hypothetical protein